jgi:hypothetical protein
MALNLMKKKDRRIHNEEEEEDKYQEYREMEHKGFL